MKVVGGEIFFVNFQDCRSVVIITYYYKLTLDAIVDYAKKLPFSYIFVFSNSSQLIVLSYILIILFFDLSVRIHV